MENNALVTTLESHLLTNLSFESRMILIDTIDRIKNIGTPTSNLLIRGTTLAIQFEGPFTISQESVNKSWEKIIAREREKGNPDPSINIDKEVWKRLEGEAISGSMGGTFTISRFTETFTHEKIFKEARKNGSKKMFNWLEAKIVAENSILAGEVDIYGTGIIIYFKDPSKFELSDGFKVTYCLHISRAVYSLVIDVKEIIYSEKFTPGSGVCLSSASNNSFNDSIIPVSAEC